MGWGDFTISHGRCYTDGKILLWLILLTSSRHGPLGAVWGRGRILNNTRVIYIYIYKDLYWRRWASNRVCGVVCLVLLLGNHPVDWNKVLEIQRPVSPRQESLKTVEIGETLRNLEPSFLSFGLRNSSSSMTRPWNSTSKLQQWTIYLSQLFCPKNPKSQWPWNHVRFVAGQMWNMVSTADRVSYRMV